MDSLALINIKIIDKKLYKKQRENTNKKIKTKCINCLQCLDLRLVILCSILVSNLYIIYLLRSKFNSIHESFFPKKPKSDKIFSSERGTNY